MTTRDEIRIAILEDNPDLREELIFFLQAKGYRVWGEHSAETFWKRLHANPADIVMLDIGLPGEDGFSVLEYLRGLGSYGLIVLSARGSQQDRFRGLELGADAYLVKPVNFANLVLTVDQLWQRLRLQVSNDTSLESLTPENWTLRGNSLSGPSGLSMPLSSQEARLLGALMRHPGQVRSKELLHEHLFGHLDEQDTHRVDVVLSRLRSRAKKQHISLPIRVVFGKGIAFVTDDFYRDN